MTIDIEKGNVVNPVDEAIRGFVVAEEALTRCTQMLQGEGISGLDIADALIQRVSAVLKPEITGDAAVLRKFMEQSILLMEDSIESFEEIRQIYATELEDL